MCLIVILGRCFSGADLIAKRVSEGLACRLIEEEALIEKAAAWGFAQEQLRNAVRPIPVLRGCFPQDYGPELAALRAALAEEAAASKTVFSGCEGFLLPRHTVPVLRIRLNVPLPGRLAELREQLRLTDGMARRHIRRVDLAYRRWVRKVSGSDEEDPALYDLVVGIDNGDVDSAFKTIADFVIRQTSLQLGPEYCRAMTNFALASRIEAVLKVIPHTTGLNAMVRVDQGIVFLAANSWDPRDRAVARGIVSVISGVRRVELIELGPRPGISHVAVRNGKGSTWRPWAVGATLCSLLIAGGMFLNWLDLNQFVETSVAGVITDTRCAGNHRISGGSERGQCVRKCVEVQEEVKYALLDGAQIYVLTDQSLGERFAARAVTIRGRLDPKNNLLEVHSIKLASTTAESLNF